jgi:hypothetical protein
MRGVAFGGGGEEILMTTGQLYRLSGASLLAGAVLSVISSVISGVLFPDSSSPAQASNPLNVTLGFIGVLGTILALLGLPALYVRRATEGGAMWLIGVVLIAITGMLFGIFAALTFVIVFPALATAAPGLLSEGPPPALLSVFIVGTLANVVGAALMAVPMLTRSLYPRWCGWLMVLEALLAAFSFFFNGPSSSGLLGQIINVIAPLPLFVVLGWVGYELWASKLGGAERVREAVSPQPA